MVGSDDKLNRNILGDKKKSSFDDNLADVVNKIFDNMPDNVTAKEPVKDAKGSNPILIRCPAVIKSQQDWISWGNLHGISIASMPDYYKFFRKLKADYKSGVAYQLPVSDILQERINLGIDFAASGVVSCTKVLFSEEINYRKQATVNCKITHISKNEEIDKINFDTPLPIAYNKRIKDFLALDGGEEYLKKLFQTEDVAELVEALSWASEKNEDQIIVDTLACVVLDVGIEPRATYFVPKFVFENDFFVIKHFDYFKDKVKARGVKYEK
ncbi:hypothetical protein HZA97_01060 [Candidatus Woesearchaeota archaeon]|nr:hypothetical protein [Candidatus Woesearchaeota archaeon]